MMFVNLLKDVVSYLYVKRLSPLPIFEICDKLKNYVKPFGLRFTDTAVCFPEMSLKEFLMYTEYVHGKYFLDGIPYASIVYICQERNNLIIYLKDGTVFCLNEDNRLGVYSFTRKAKFKRHLFFFRLRINKLKRRIGF